MRPTTARLALATAGLAALGLIGPVNPASAGTKPLTLVVSDASGDAVGKQAATDIKSLVFTTSGRTTTKIVSGRKVVTYTPTTLIIRMALAAAPSALPFAYYGIDAETSGCGSMYLFFDGQDLASGGFLEKCGPKGATGSTYELLPYPTVSGSTITWAFPFTKLPASMRAGARISSIHGYTTLAEPITGGGPYLFTEGADLDSSKSSKAYVVG